MNVQQIAARLMQDEVVGQAQNPSEIRDLLTNQLFRQG